MGGDRGGAPGDAGPRGVCAGPAQGDGADHLRGDQEQRGRVSPAVSGEGERASRQEVPPNQRYEVQLEDEAKQDLKSLYRRERKAWQEINAFLDKLEGMPEVGYELTGEWEGCFAVHIARDRYRIIWELLPPEEDYSGEADEVIPIVILTVGPKTDSSGRTIYETSERPLR